MTTLAAAKVDLDSIDDRALLREIRARGYQWFPCSREARCVACGAVTREWELDLLHVGGHDTPVLHVRCMNLTACMTRQSRAALGAA